jgi:hypothetical protein
MKKLKIGFGEGGFPGFMARHVEKCVLVSVILLMAWFIYSGTGTSALDKKITKESLKKNAAEAESRINNSKWEPIAQERDPHTDVEKVIVNQKDKIDPRAYACKVWDSPLVPRLLPRLDPKVIAAEKLVVFPVQGPLALFPAETDDDKVADDPLDKFTPVLGGSAVSSSFGGMDEGDNKKGKKSRDTSKSSGGPPPSASGSKGSGKKKKDEPYESPPSFGGSSSMGSKSARTIPPEMTVGVHAPSGARIQPAQAMIICAVVPFSKQWEEYRVAFKDSRGGQDPERDVPKYIAVWVDRLDVTDDPTIDPATAKGWKRLKLRELVRMEDKEYAAQVRELADPDAIDPKLTHPVPPFLLTDLRPALLHPDVPRMSFDIAKEKVEDTTDAVEIDEGGEIIRDSAEAGSGSGGMGQRGFGSGGFGSGGMGQRGFGSGGSRPGKGGGPPPRGGMGQGSGRGSSGYGSGGMSSGPVDFETYRPVSKKLVRFVDFEAQPGHKYRYCVTLVLDDPNRPLDPASEPDPTSLDEKVRERVKTAEQAEEKKAEELKKAGGDPADARQYYSYIKSPVSEPSEVVTMPSSEWFYAGESVPAATITINGATIATNEPSSKVLAVQWDATHGIFAPAEQVVHRASTLNYHGDIEFLHPTAGDLRKYPNYDLHTDGIVLDMFGGEKLPGTGDSKEPIRAPGETLIMDAQGNLVVTDEARDIEGYRRFIVPEPKVEAPPKEASGPGASMSEGMAPPSASGSYPGGKGKGGKPGGAPNPKMGKPGK